MTSDGAALPRWNIERSSTDLRLCFLGPYLEAARRFGHPVAEHLMFGMVSGPVFEFAYIHDGRQVSAPLSDADWISVVGAEEIRLADLEDAGVTGWSRGFSDSAQAVSMVADLLDKGEVAVVFVDVHDLPYHPLRDRVHGQTSLLLHARRSGAVDFTDTYVQMLRPERVTGTMALTELSRLLSCDGEIRREVVACAPYRGARRRDALPRIAAAARAMAAPSRPRAGLAGMLALADEMASWPDIWRGQPLANNFREMHGHVTRRSGPLNARKVYAEFLRASGERDADLLSPAAEGFLESARMWQAVAAIAFRGSLQPQESFIAKIAAKLRQIATLEGEVFAMLSLRLPAAQY